MFRTQPDFVEPLIRLFRLMSPNDSRRITGELGVKNQNVLFGWVKALNVLRNHCAHDARIWNRTTVYPPDRINSKMVDDELHHLTSADTNRFYFLVAVLAYLVNRIDLNSRFESDVKTTMTKFPRIDGYSSEGTMGFVDDWREQALWAT